MQGFEKIEDILEGFLGSPKNGTDSPQQQYNCPCCAQENGGIPDGKYNLEINLILGKYKCWKCEDTHGTKGNLSRLIRQYGGQTSYKRYKAEIDSIIKTKLYDINAFVEKPVAEVYKQELVLPKTFRRINLNGYCKPMVREYLESRNIDQNIVDKYNMGYTEWEENDKDWSYRIIIPSYDEYGDINFFVGRDYTNNKKRIKYKNCDAPKKDIIFQESLIDWDSDIILVEGALDCVYFTGNSIALLGKVLKPDMKLYQAIRDKANGKIIICLDSDTNPIETKNIYNLLNKGRLRDKIWYIDLGRDKDFGEIYEQGGAKAIAKAISNARQFKETELIY